MPESTTGFNPWFTYEPHRIPGIGTAYANVGNGNVIVAVTDIDIPERGINLTLKRYYNSQSAHDTNGSDGTTPSVWGNGWTTPLDTHMVQVDPINNPQLISVYAGDGARYDYSCPVVGFGGQCWQLTTGDHRTLNWDPNNPCAYSWTMTTGVVYELYSPAPDATACSTVGTAMYGRLAAIYGRNHNNSITLQYSWLHGMGNDPENLTSITVLHNDGHQLLLTFGLASGSHPRELVSAQMPDGSKVNYNYDAFGNLLEVDHPANNVTKSVPETYVLYPDVDQSSQNTQYQFVCSPRFGLASINGSNNTSTDGACLKMSFDSANRLSEWFDAGVVNFTPADGTNLPLQQIGAGWLRLNETYFSYGADDSCATGTSGAFTCIQDDDGHNKAYQIDGASRTTAMQLWHAAGDSNPLVSSQTWDDSTNNRTSETDFGGNTSDFMYDGYGNLIESAGPLVSTSNGSLRPTTIYTYDTNNNLRSFCDPVRSHALGMDWPISGTAVPQTCPTSGSGQIVMTWTATGSEPLGELTNVQSAVGYNYAIYYSVGSQGGALDYGLPTKIAATTATEDGRSPRNVFTYDAFGNLSTYDAGDGNAWTLTYTNVAPINRITTILEPGHVNPSQTCYYADGSVAYTESAYQRKLDGSIGCQSSAPSNAVAYMYDADGNLFQEIHHHGGQYAANPNSLVLPGTGNVTTRWYDGLDRLVEVVEPQDPSDLFSTPWITRYIYDITGYLSSPPKNYFNSTTAVTAHGNMWKVEEYLPSTNPLSYAPSPAPSGAPSFGSPFIVTNQQPASGFQDMKAAQYDALDRVTSTYALVTANGTSGTLSSKTFTYDAGGFTNAATGVNDFPGLLNKSCNALGQCERFAYDTRSLPTNVHDNDSTNMTSRVEQLDADGRPTTVEAGDAYTGRSSGYSYAYAQDGSLLTESEPNALSNSMATQHNYYADGLEKSLGLTKGLLSSSAIFTYGYDNVGRLSSKTISTFGSGLGGANAGTSTMTYAYTGAGRLATTSAALAGSSGTLVTSRTYTSGLLTSITFPPASPVPTGSPSPTPNTLSAIEYNAEAELLGYCCARVVSPIDGSVTYGSATYTYSTRGELERANAFANGVSLSTSQSTTWDTRMGVPLAAGGGSWIYDKAGRMIKETIPAGLNMRSSVTLSRSYDAENRLVSTSGVAQPYHTDPLATPAALPLSNSETWTPIGQVGSVGGVNPANEGTGQDTLHWSSGGLLYSTTSSNTVDDLKIGSEGDLVPHDPGYNGLTLYERGPEGLGGCYNARAATAYSANPPFQTSTWAYGSLFEEVAYEPAPPCQQSIGFPHNLVTSASFGSFAQYTPIGQGGTLGMPREDGVATGTDIIQGVRAYDPNLGTWTTPDAFSGVADDPVSQKSYQWVNNNPISNADPTGNYCLEHVMGSNGWSLTPGCNGRQEISPDDGADEYQNELDLAAMTGSPVDAGYSAAGCDDPGPALAQPPAGAPSISSAFADGLKNTGWMTNPMAALKTADGMIGGGGKYDYQRFGGTFNSVLRPASNFIVGVYAYAMGLDINEMETGIGGLLAQEGHTELYMDDAKWSEMGWKWASVHCHR